jgi:hypothetical protein
MEKKQTKIKPQKTQPVKKKSVKRTKKKQVKPVSWWEKSKFNLWWKTFKKYFKI